MPIVLQCCYTHLWMWYQSIPHVFRITNKLVTQWYALQGWCYQKPHYVVLCTGFPLKPLQLGKATYTGTLMKMVSCFLKWSHSLIWVSLCTQNSSLYDKHMCVHHHCLYKLCVARVSTYHEIHDTSWTGIACVRNRDIIHCGFIKNIY